MLMVTRLLSDATPFPRRTMYHKSAIDVLNIYNLTREEFVRGLETGEVVRGHIIEFAPYFLEQMALDEEIAQHGPYGLAEIAERMDENYCTIRQVLCRLKKKISKSLRVLRAVETITPELPPDVRYRTGNIRETVPA